MKEYKAIKVKGDYELEVINQTMNDMAKEGYEMHFVFIKLMVHRIN